MADQLPLDAIAVLLGQMTGGDGGMGWGTAMMVAMVAVTVLVIVGVVWLVRALVRGREEPRMGDDAPGSALQILERRFAAGEIDVEEYRERRSELLAAR
jgi:putative membrane protein